MRVRCGRKLLTEVVDRSCGRKLWTEVVDESCGRKLWTEVVESFGTRGWTVDGSDFRSSFLDRDRPYGAQNEK